MIRLIIENILLFLLPTILYVIYTMLRHSGERSNSISRTLATAPLPVLFAAGVALMATVLALYSEKSDGGKPGQVYRPPTVVDGKLQPGRFE